MLKYIKIGFYFLKEIFYYSYIFIFNNIHLLIFVFILTFLVTFGVNSKGIDNISGISIGMYARYVFITEIIMTNRKDNDMVNEIKSGSIVTYLNKPISFIGYYFSQGFFKNIIKIIIIGICSGLIIFAFVGEIPRFGFGKFLIFIISLLIGIGMMTLVSLIIGLFAFIFEDSSFIRLFIMKLYFIFGGVYFPIDIYPTRLQSISKILPFQYYVYGPAKFFTTGDINFFLSYFPYQIVWFVLLIIIVKLIYNKLLRKVEINGG